MSDARVAVQRRFPPYVHIDGIRNPKLEKVPALELFQELGDSERVVRSYAIRVRRPKLSRTAVTIGVLVALVVLAELARTAASGIMRLGASEAGLLLVVLALLSIPPLLRRRRGHTYLYLTDRRIVIVALEEGLSGRTQTVLNYNIKDIAGFQVFVQRGIWRLLSVLKLRERRTFYIAVLTGSRASFTLGALDAQGSQYDPGRDAVTLCAELDSTLLAIKAGMTARMEVA